MITVAILINGNPIVARNAVNIGQRAPGSDECAYETDSGAIIYHDPVDGAVALAHKLLDEIKNDKPQRGK